MAGKIPTRSIFRSSQVGALTRGGQTTLHYLRMMVQVAQAFIYTMVFGFLVLSTYLTWTWTSERDRYAIERYIVAQFNAITSGVDDQTIPYTNSDGRKVQAQVRSIIESAKIQAAVKRGKANAMRAMIFGTLLSIALFVLGLYYFSWTGKGQVDNHFIRGNKLLPARELIRKMRMKRVKGRFTFGGIKVPQDQENDHVFIVGGPGTGKSNSMRKILNEMRQADQRAIVFDVAGTFVETFYRPGKDIILNPLDKRCIGWTPWNEMKMDYHYDHFANALLPVEAKKDPFWTQAAQMAMAALLRKIGDDPHRTIKSLYQAATTLQLDELSDIIDGTEAAPVLAQEGERMAAGVRADMSTRLRAFKFMQHLDGDFSIRDWVANDDEDRWIFITSKNDQKSLMRPIVSAWLDVAASAILSLPQDVDRRIFYVIDELHSLQRMSTLQDFLAQARKHGGSAWLATQSIPQLIEIYGREGTNAIMGNCATLVSYRVNDPESAEWISKAMGKTEQVETQEGLSMGSHEIRDGVTLSRDRKIREIVLDAELMALKDLTGYLRLGHGFPVALFTDKYKPFDKPQPGFVEGLPILHRGLSAEKSVVAEREEAKRKEAEEEKKRIDEINAQEELLRRDIFRASTGTDAWRDTGGSMLLDRTLGTEGQFPANDEQTAPREDTTAVENTQTVSSSPPDDNDIPLPDAPPTTKRQKAGGGPNDKTSLLDL